LLLRYFWIHGTLSADKSFDDDGEQQQQYCLPEVEQQQQQEQEQQLQVLVLASLASPTLTGLASAPVTPNSSAAQPSPINPAPRAEKGESIYDYLVLLDLLYRLDPYAYIDAVVGVMATGEVILWQHSLNHLRFNYCDFHLLLKRGAKGLLYVRQ
jgi:hypothetical protein